MQLRPTLVKAIAAALRRCRHLAPTMAQTHNTNEARLDAAGIIADEILKLGLVIKEKPRAEGHKTPGA